MIQSLARGLEALTLLSKMPEGLSVTEVAEALVVDKSTAMRLMKTLVEAGFAVQSKVTRRYYLSMKLVGLGYRYLNDLDLRQMAIPLLENLVKLTKESAHLAILADNEALVLDDIVTTEALRVETGSGRFSPLHCTAIGKSLLAFSEIPIPNQLTRFTDKTITTQKSLQTHLEAIREQGYALDDEEYTIGVRCLAAPVFDKNGLCIATIGISGPAIRVTVPKVNYYSELVMESASEMQNILSKLT